MAGPTAGIDPKEEPVIYVIGFDHYVKIGFSRNVRQRRRALQDGLPRALDTYLVIPGGSFRTEKELHIRFSRYRLRGEWFLFAGELAAWIEEQVGILSDRRRRRQADNLPEHRLEAIKRRNKNEWLDERLPNPWDVVLER